MQKRLERYGGDDPVKYFNNKYSNNSQLGNKGDDGSKFTVNETIIDPATKKTYKVDENGVCRGKKH